MSEQRNAVGRRHLLVLGAAATLHSACSSDGTPLGGPYGGTTNGVPPVLGGAEDGGEGTGSSGGTASSSGGTTSSSGGTTSSSGGTTSSSGGTTSSSSGGDDAGSSGGEAGGSCSCPTGGSILALTFSQYPKLQQVGGSVTLNATGYSDPKCGLNQIIVFQPSAGTFTALSTSCTHACCPVSFTGSGFHCPCHGATFDLTGKPTNNVTSKPLASLPVCSDSCGVYVTV